VAPTSLRSFGAGTAKREMLAFWIRVPARLPLRGNPAPDGSVIMGGDPNGGSTPNERYRPSYFFKPRPVITASPATIAHGAAFSVDTATPGGIAEVVLMRAGAVVES